MLSYYGSHVTTLVKCQEIYSLLSSHASSMLTSLVLWLRYEWSHHLVDVSFG